MPFYTGLDIGGSKIAGAVFTGTAKELAREVVATPGSYAGFLSTCRKLVDKLEAKAGHPARVGIGIAGCIDRQAGKVFAPNIPYLRDRPLRQDFEKSLERTIRMANDADCAALSEAWDGAGKGHHSVFTLILGTGVGGGLVVDKKIYEGAHGLAGEIGHLPLPFREYTDGPIVPCACKQQGCIEQSISGPALTRLYESMTGYKADAVKIAALARQGDAGAMRTLDQFYTTVSKAMVTVLHTYDPDIIVVSGGLCQLPGLYEEVPKHWSQYALPEKLKTKFVPAKHGSMTGVRGAAWLNKQRRQRS